MSPYGLLKAHKYHADMPIGLSNVAMRCHTWYDLLAWMNSGYRFNFMTPIHASTSRGGSNQTSLRF
jgi:hypothetical protein